MVPAIPATPFSRGSNPVVQVHVPSVFRAVERHETQSVLICLLGSFQLLADGRPVTLRGGGKAEALLGALASRSDQGLSRDRIIDALWPDSDAVLAGQSLNTLVYSLHRLLGEALGGAAPVVYSGGWYRLNLEAGVAVDVAEFDQLVDTADQLTQRTELNPAAEAYQSAVDLYRGDLCVGPDIQSLIERERVRARFLTVLARLADYHFAAEDYAACLAVVQRLLAVDGCREDAHRLVMRCHVRRGERGQALRQYRLCESILAGEFNAPPEPATTALFERIRLDPAGV